MEGPDDLGVLVAVLQHLGMDQRVRVKPSGGINQLLADLPTQLKESDLARLGVVVDADTDAQGWWDALRAVLFKFGYSHVPRKPSATGTIITDVDRPTVGIWIMPDNQHPGAVEHFARQLVASADVLWPEAEATIRRVAMIDRRFAPVYEMKAIIHTWLAWQAEPGRPMGQAITKRFLDPASAHANALYAWLRALFP